MKSIVTLGAFCALPVCAAAQCHRELFSASGLNPSPAALSTPFEDHAGLLAFTSRKSAGAIYQNPSAIQGFRFISCQGILPFQSFTVSAAWNQLGFSDYREQEAHLKVAIRAGKKAGIGAGFHYFTRIAGAYGKQPGYAFSVGMAVKPDPRWLLSAQVQNPAEFKFNDSQTIVPVNYGLKIAHGLSNQVVLGLSLSKYNRDPLQPFLFAGYQPHERWGINGGVGINPAQAGAALYVTLGGFTFWGSLQYNQWLGTTPGAAFSFAGKS